MARRRPSAFEVSFPDEVEMAPPEAERTKSTHMHAMDSRSSSVASTSSLGKRKQEGLSDQRSVKRQQLPKAAYYKKKKDAQVCIEDDKLIILGEDPDPDDDTDEKPIRELHKFSIFDPKHRKELVTLEALEQDDGVDRQFEAAGFVTPYFVNKEDEGQEDQDQENNLEQLQYVNLSAILRYTIDYSQDSEPFYIETQYAWYILKSPAEHYQPFYEHFYSPRRIAQIVISRALNAPQELYKSFLETFTSKVDIFGRTYLEQYLWDSIVEIHEAILNETDFRKIMAVPFVKSILRRSPMALEASRPARQSGPKFKRQPKIKSYLGNIDLAVLKDEHQNTTCVTPRIAKLAQGLFREKMRVIGRPPTPLNKSEEDAYKTKAFKVLNRLIAKAKKPKKEIDYHKADRVSVQSGCYSSVDIDRKKYSIGDVVLVPNTEMLKRVLNKTIHPDLDSRIDHFFWFARIMYIIIDSQKVHLQWFHHGSQTIMSELAHPQELFLSDLCGHESLHAIVGKVTVHLSSDITSLDRRDEYFCKFTHDANLGTFTSIDFKSLELLENQSPPNNCPVCPIHQERDFETNARELKDGHGHVNGVAFAGSRYHLEDFVLYRAKMGPAHIGYITNFEFSKQSATVTMRKVGRVADLAEILSEGALKDERHLFLTDETEAVEVKELLRVIYVPSYKSFKEPEAALEDWLDLSYDHFYLKYAFPSMEPGSWNDKKRVGCEALGVCATCLQERLDKRKRTYEFIAESQNRALSTLDLFSGVGAFSRGLAEGSGGCLEVTHAIEIGPSAAKTFKQNHPGTIVYNQCANEMLRWIIKSLEGHEVEVPNQKYDDKTPVPPPPKRGEIQVITAGFPCQSHSTLNMYKSTEDIKSNLILTTLAYMDYYSPSFGYFENVPGFLKFSLNATQANEHQAMGDIEMGGLKLLIRALIDMNYQVRFGLLQAGHYGTPQRRVRFFMVVAKHGQVLPELPQPTHDFPDSKTLNIKYPENEISPIRMAHGTALHRVVTIEDAIGDLPRFDWKHPKPRSEKPEVQKKREKRLRIIPSIECKTSEPYCGFSGQIGYHMNPQTRYQKSARLIPTTDIQHYTKVLLPRKVERVLNIPLKAGADYRNLPAALHEWQFVDPTSSVGKMNYRPGMYGRLHGSEVFPTTVTNVDPTAKQSRVLHPLCYRMVTVRELARSQGFPDSFVFHAIGNNIVTMHRQIGNAVPLPVARGLHSAKMQSLLIDDADGQLGNEGLYSEGIGRTRGR
ncbi:hypothetical protein GALMADRAFT_218616 [Galerina marginata CBS 339.88]|uniref:DNA (cytosine-5-)-methyltransferase n=1 Tax=Galerina marginata (strain CBS 339.88) TaxID=685588 RepID=A0A067TT91_GALM3|nr:hypothetical protein GALMADRAFT_218616 [Galerina marginata CBS 339.88]